MIQCMSECWELVCLCILRLCFNLFHYFLLQVGICDVIAVVDNLILLKLRLQLTFPLRNIICTLIIPYLINALLYITLAN